MKEFHSVEVLPSTFQGDDSMVGKRLPIILQYPSLSFFS